MDAQRHPSPLDLDEHIRVQRAWWRIERAAWVVISLVMAAVCLGVAGDGAALRTIVQGDRAVIAFDRFARRQAPALLEARWPSADGGTVKLERSLADAIDIRRLSPAPRRSVLERRWLVLEFDVSPDSDACLRIEYCPRRAAMLSGRIEFAGGDTLECRQFVHP